MINKTNKFGRWKWEEGIDAFTVVSCSIPKAVIPKIGYSKIVYTIILLLDFIGLQQTAKYFIQIVSAISTTSTYQQYQK